MLQQFWWTNNIIANQGVGGGVTTDSLQTATVSTEANQRYSSFGGQAVLHLEAKC